MKPETITATEDAGEFPTLLSRTDRRRVAAACAHAAVKVSRLAETLALVASTLLSDTDIAGYVLGDEATSGLAMMLDEVLVASDDAISALEHA